MPPNQNLSPESLTRTPPRTPNQNLQPGSPPRSPCSEPSTQSPTQNGPSPLPTWHPQSHYQLVLFNNYSPPVLGQMFSSFYLFPLRATPQHCSHIPGAFQQVLDLMRSALHVVLSPKDAEGHRSQAQQRLEPCAGNQTQGLGLAIHTIIPATKSCLPGPTLVPSIAQK